MRFDFALLADAAQTVEGKLYVQGGGLTRVTTPALPWMQSLAICMRVEFEAGDDPAQQYQFEVAVLGPDEQPIFGPHTSPVAWQIPGAEAVEGEERGGFIALTINVLVLQSPGPHLVTLAIDGASAALPFAVVVVPGPG